MDLLGGEIVSCTKHGDAYLCFVNPDGSHVSATECVCVGRFSADCAVEQHRDQAGDAKFKQAPVLNHKKYKHR